MAFLRRFDRMPSIDVLSEIESVVAIDGVETGVPIGVATNVAACVGEFADVTYGVAISANGVITTQPRPIRILGGDFEDKAGGFDETLGDHGASCGNGWLEVKNKAFGSLVIVPVNNASSQGVRLYRELATNKSATDPSPVQAIEGVTVPAGTEFRSGANRVRLAQSTSFLGSAEYHRGTDGAVTNAASAATQTFDSASGNFLALVRDDGLVGVKVNDIIVIGVIGAAGAQGANAGTYRVNAVTDADTLVLEKMDGTNFAWTTGTGMAWRLYTGGVADTGGENHIGTQAGYRIPARPLDATIAINTTLTPTVQADPVAPTATAAAPLSGLRMRSATVTGIVYTAAVQAPNTTSNATLEALYEIAIAALHEDVDPSADVSIVWSARKANAIRLLLTAFVAKRKRQGRGCVAPWSPALDTLSKDVALGDAAPGVGAARSREHMCVWPGFQTFASQAVGKRLRRADGTYVTTGILDTAGDGWLASVMSSLLPEKNPGEVSPETQELLANALGLQLGVTGLDFDFYKRANAKGLVAPRISRGQNGQNFREFQSGITTSLSNGEKEINVRRFSFYVQDTAKGIAEPFSKRQFTPTLEADLVTQLASFAEQLLADERIAAYEGPSLAQTTKAMRQRGIVVVKMKIEMIVDARVIVLDIRTGLGVLEVTTSVE